MRSLLVLLIALVAPACATLRAPTPACVDAAERALRAAYESVTVCTQPPPPPAAP